MLDKIIDETFEYLDESIIYDINEPYKLLPFRGVNSHHGWRV